MHVQEESQFDNGLTELGANVQKNHDEDARKAQLAIVEEGNLRDATDLVAGWAP